MRRRRLGNGAADVRRAGAARARAAGRRAARRGETCEWRDAPPAPSHTQWRRLRRPICNAKVCRASSSDVRGTPPPYLGPTYIFYSTREGLTFAEILF
ncbi:hypothetical protein EVAR_81625_1 [Eumeta japonica]|uniref:Uncharacterized protein n=1 Tax=Eumeta variegata TaxID=151549 RepID=A0A4C1WG19_EUMVA|nr:hypothetical protein EVAR_81625_1 [Eumeta japonica]